MPPPAPRPVAADSPTGLMPAVRRKGGPLWVSALLRRFSRGFEPVCARVRSVLGTTPTRPARARSPCVSVPTCVQRLKLRGGIGPVWVCCVFFVPGVSDDVTPRTRRFHSGVPVCEAAGLFPAGQAQCCWLIVGFGASSFFETGAILASLGNTSNQTRTRRAVASKRDVVGWSLVSGR